MPRAREVRVAEPLDRRVVVAIARRVIVTIADRARRVGIGAELHHSQRRDRAAPGVPLAAGADDRIDCIIGPGRGLPAVGGREQLVSNPAAATMHHGSYTRQTAGERQALYEYV